MSVLPPTHPLPTRPASSGDTILIVNDDPDTLFLLEHEFSRAVPAARILTATDGQKGLDLWLQQPVSVIVTDNRMPHMNGIALTSRVRLTDPHLPVIMVTAALETRAEALQAGVTVFCVGHSPEEVVAALKTCLGGR